jgi:hypothetical protein
MRRKGSPSISSSRGDVEQRDLPRPTGARDACDTNQGLYLTFLGAAVVSGLTFAGLFLFGPDPDRFADFDDYAEVALGSAQDAPD